MKKWILSIGVVLTLTFVTLVLRTSSTSRQDCKLISGVISEIEEGGVKDAVFILAGTSRKYYINRGLENNFNLNELRLNLTGKKATVLYSDQWTLLDPFNNSANQIAELRIGQEVIHPQFAN